MSFSLTDDQKAVRDLVGQIFTATCDKESLDKLEHDGGFFAQAAWDALAESGLAAMAVDERYGGAGLGLVEQCIVLRQAGRHVAPVPLLESSVMAAPTIATFADDAVRSQWLPKLVSGEVILTCALTDANSRDPVRPTTTAKRDDAGQWRLSGCKTCVPWPEQAKALLVSGQSTEDVGLWLVERSDTSMTFAPQRATDNQPMAEVTLDDTPATFIGGGDALQMLLDRGVLGRCAIAVGVADMALALTAEYCRTREQFGAPIGTFQAVSQRTGDMYVDCQVMELSMMAAAWRLQAAKDGEPADQERQRALWTARYWTTEAGHRVVSAAQHLHGGTGFDRDYPLYRCFLRARRLELGLGTARESLATIGDLLAR